MLLLRFRARERSRSVGRFPAWRVRRLYPKIAPTSRGVANLVRSEVGFILQRRASFDIVAQVDVRDPAQRSRFNDAQNIPVAQGTVTLGGLIKAINRRQSARQIID